MRSPVTQVYERTVKANLTPWGCTITLSNKTYTFVNHFSSVVDTDETGNLLLGTVVQ